MPELQQALKDLRRGGARVALVPTMGALHEGHMELVRAARRHAEKVAVYIFVNPMQFAPHEDLARYPRPFAEDVRRLEAEGVDLLYAPAAEAVYPPGFATVVSVKGVSEGMEGAFRPHFFDGVATVLAKMFIRMMPEVAVFGEKDYQQLAVVRRMAADLDLPVEIVGVPTRREEGGTAMSSRNAYLTEQERRLAPRLYHVLCETAEALRRGGDVAATLSGARERLIAEGFAKVDYLELRDAASLEPLAAPDREGRLLVAVWLGTTRLIDNIPLPLSSAD